MRFNYAPRAAVYMALGLDIAFKQGRGITWAISMLAWLGIGLTVANLAPLLVAKFRDRLTVTHWLPEAAIASALLAAAFANPYGNEAGGYNYFVDLVAAWGFGNLIINGVSAYLAKPESQQRKELFILAALNLALGVLYALAPLGAIPAVGFLGAYLVIVGVHLGISAASSTK
jgi:hypothetical protein